MSYSLLINAHSFESNSIVQLVQLQIQSNNSKQFLLESMVLELCLMYKSRAVVLNGGNIGAIVLLPSGILTNHYCSAICYLMQNIVKQRLQRPYSIVTQWYFEQTTLFCYPHLTSLTQSQSRITILDGYYVWNETEYQTDLVCSFLVHI